MKNYINCTIDIASLYDKCDYQLQHFKNLGLSPKEYDKDWTPLRKLTKYEANQFLSDSSIYKVRLVFGGTVLEISPIQRYLNHNH